MVKEKVLAGGRCRGEGIAGKGAGDSEGGRQEVDWRWGADRWMLLDTLSLGSQVVPSEPG